MATTRQLNHEPIAMLGLTQSELSVVLWTSVGVAVPTGLVLSILIGSFFGFMYGLLSMLAVSGFLGLGLGWALSKWIQFKKSDKPDGFLKQQFQIKWQRNRWLPPIGIFHYKRSGKSNGLH